MKFSYQWISELVPGLDSSPADLQRLITMKTAECEGIEAVGGHFGRVVAARVMDVTPLPKSKNKTVAIAVGNGKTVQVVCGAPNVRVGVLAAWVPPGTALEGKTIASAVIEGIQSDGMLASAAELGIGRDHSGILELDGVEPGEPLPGLVPDWIIEVDNKSLTHRPDLWGHYGMAREVAAITKRTLKEPVHLDVLPTGDPVVRVEIEDFSLCPRYSALILENVRVGPSPLWLQARLQNVGLNPINNIVDVTNYVLAELPQPMHAFDADKLSGHEIFIRSARPEEQLSALNGEAYHLSPADLLIADASGPIALAGVIGGAASAISEITTRVILESANFEASRVRLTSARHKLRTDASMRFEKALDPENTVRGLARAVELLNQVCPGIRVVGGVSDSRSEVKAAPAIPLSVEVVTRKLGISVTQAQITDILTALGFRVIESTPGTLTVTAPSWRATKDISVKDDLVEEIGRMIGYGEIPPVAPFVASVPPPPNPVRGYIRQKRLQLAGQGFNEVYNYSFLKESDLKRFSFSLADHLVVRNPIASELTHLRRSLLPGLFENVISNVRHSTGFRLFEIGNEVHPSANGDLPREPLHLAAVLYDLHADEQDFFEMKRVLECLFPEVKLKQVTALAYEHPARTAQAEWNGSMIGRLFEIHPSLLRTEGVEGRAVFFDIDLQIAQELNAQRTIRYSPLRKYPISGFDLSVVSDMHTPVASIEAELIALAGSSLASIEFVRQYSGPPFPEGRKSVSYHLEVGALDHTQTAEELAEIRNRIIDGMQASGFELRV